MRASITTIGLLALTGVSAWKTQIEHSEAFAEELMRDSGYSLEDLEGLVDNIVDQCDSNGCDVNRESCDNAFCIKIDGDNSGSDTDGIQDTVRDFIKKSIQTEETTDSGCTSSGCAFAPAHYYRVPEYTSLQRTGDDGSANALYKVTWSANDHSGTCDDVFKALEAAIGLVPGGSLFGAVTIAAC
ncbi:uncharacterized protein B0I36DRAFT_387113 [Microdochium trichocladiopsis]|uniref:Uncharacterized protein n=1 Tax=Microdochium trichocladiopsis TaxID=1682393 RepID=A0A9P8XZL9_9PEZI|nr:uncharacterized protein B0I36DRAFT_387113 [Microdochium trichocladiopsis]KAH7024568.1 hypothetical protein B0I36DRAFT_387113 [Microdochium trichocladiopsis]